MANSSKMTITIKPWMILSVVAIVGFVTSYVAAITMPECPNCGRFESNAIQNWHTAIMVIMIATGAGGIFGAVISYFVFED